MNVQVIDYSVDAALDDALNVTMDALRNYRPMLLDQHQAGDEGEMIAHLAEQRLLVNGFVDSSNASTIYVAYFPQADRACIVDNAGTHWTDASSIEEAIKRYRDGDLVA